VRETFFDDAEFFHFIPKSN